MELRVLRSLGIGGVLGVEGVLGILGELRLLGDREAAAIVFF